MISLFKPYRLGIVITVIYLLAAVPCAMMYWYEYSIPMLIVYWSSLPAVYGLFGLKLFVEFIGIEFPLSDGWLWRTIIILCQCFIYFLAAEGVSYVVRKIRAGRSGR